MIENRPKTWAHKEAERVHKKCGKTRGHDPLFETGFGPSGLPHIGTVAEMIRTTFVARAYEKMYGKKPKIVMFSDDMDALRKVPTNIPNPEILEQNMGKPLCDVPDPFGCCESFSAHNINLMLEFLKSAGFENGRDFESIRASDKYKSGDFDEKLLKIGENADKILKIILPTLGEERRKTYCPFLPINPENGKVEHDILNWRIEKDVMFFDTPEKKGEKVKITGGGCKLQWKVDWAMRWMALGVDFEMHGKDLIDSGKIGEKFCRALGETPPELFVYELFLDENGEKISKSKGNGLEFTDWQKYAPRDVLAYFLFQNPKKARAMHWGVIPKSVDEYLAALQKNDACIEILHPDVVPNADFGGLTFGMMLNLVTVANSDDPEVLEGFLEKYLGKKIDSSLLDEMIVSAINFYKNFVEPNKKFRTPTEDEKKMLKRFAEMLKNISESERTAEKIQFELYELGKEFYGKENLKEWFKLIYETLFGTSQGPRMGTFVQIFGIGRTVGLIESRI